MRTHNETLNYLRDNPIEPNSIWIAIGSDGEVIRRIRILGGYIEKDGSLGDRYIYEEMPAKIYTYTHLGITPGYNLGRIFEKES